MTSRDFCFWLQGYLELTAEGMADHDVQLNADQVSSIRRHLSLVFVHEIDPSAGSEKVQEALNEIHKHPQFDKKKNPDGMMRC